MTGRRTIYYAVYPDAEAPRDEPWGLFRRVFEGEREVGQDAYHPQHGWHQTDYWLRTTLGGEPDDFLEEVDQHRAQVIQAYFQALHHR